MRFKWLGRSPVQAVVCMAVVFVHCKGISVEQAVIKVLENGLHCRNPEFISNVELRRLCKKVGAVVVANRAENERRLAHREKWKTSHNKTEQGSQSSRLRA